MAERRPKTPRSIINKYQPLVAQEVVTKRNLFELGVDILNLKGQLEVKLPGETEVHIKQTRDNEIYFRFIKGELREGWTVSSSTAPKGSERFYTSITFYLNTPSSFIVGNVPDLGFRVPDSNLQLTPTHLSKLVDVVLQGLKPTNKRKN